MFKKNRSIMQYYKKPIVIRFWGQNIDSIPIDVCHGEIPDIFRTSMFGPTTELELPDAKGSDKDFQHLLLIYRIAQPVFANIVIGWSQEKM